MRTLTRLIAVAALCSSLLAAVAHASSRASGFVVSTAGGATLVPSSDSRRLAITFSDATGQSGVDVALSRMQGHTLSCASSWSSLDQGEVCSFSWGTSNPTSVGSGGLSQGRLSFHRTQDGVSVAMDLSSLSSSPSMTCLLYRGGSLITSISMPSLSTFSLLSPPAVPTLIPTASFELDPATHRCLSSVLLQSPALFVFGGSSLQVDRVVCTGDCDDTSELDVCSVRVTSPSPGVPHSIVWDSMSCVRFGTTIAVVDLSLDGSPDLLVADRPGQYQVGLISTESSLFHRVYGHGGGGGGGSVALSSLDTSSPPASLQLSRTNPFTLSPSDVGASFECRVMGSSTNGPALCSSNGELAALQLHVVAQDARISSRFSGMCADRESVIVYLDSNQRTYTAGRFQLEIDGFVVVRPVPGGPQVIPMQAAPVKCSKSNVTNNLVAPDGDSHAGSPGAGSSAATTVVGPDGLVMSMEFLTPQVFCVGGTCVTGNRIQFQGQCSSGTCAAMSIAGSNFSLQRGTAPSSSSSSLQIVGITQSGAVDQVSAFISPGVALSSSTPVVHVPVIIDRVNPTPARGTSVEVELSPNLVLATPVAEGDYFSRFGTSQMFVVPEGGGRYLVDQALLGPGCGPTAGGTLFTLAVTRAPGAPDGTGSVSVVAVQLADCNAAAMPSSPGGPSFIVLDSSPPAAVSLTASQVTSGNDRDGTIKLAFSWTAPEPFATVQLYRWAYTGYPEFSGGATPGSLAVPPTSFPPPPRWLPVSLSCSSNSAGVSVCSDETSSRDAYQFTLVVTDAAGNASAFSNITSPIKNYFAGDASDGRTFCQGDNLVTTADVSAMATYYGLALPPGSPAECVDFGPTFGGTVSGLPLCDHRISFADLILLAIRYSLVSMPAATPQPVAATANALRLRVPPLPGVGQTFDVAVEMSAAGDAQGVSTQLAFDPAVVEPVTASQGDLLGRQGREALVLSSGPGNVDAALLGVGTGLAGEGDLARVTFRVKAAGDPRLGIAGAEARDAQNRVIALSGISVPGATPGHTALRMTFPNPFDKSTTVVLSLSQSGPASVRVFDVAGRTVRTLLAGVQPAGEKLLAWDGRDDAGARLGAGVYMVRLEAGGHQETRAVRLVK